MILTDTHTHLYLEQFDEDRSSVVERAIQKGVEYMILPNIDSKSIDAMLDVCNQFPKNCFPMIGLHPTSVFENYEEELNIVETFLANQCFRAIGEIGIDLYWDKTFVKEQEIAFKYQIALANKYDLPIVIHSRNSMNEIFRVLEEVNLAELKGVFHCFSGSLEDAQRIIDMGFLLGIGGVVTFKNSNLPSIIEQIDTKHLLLETDAPYLTPVPFRGKRNESAYTYYVAEKIAKIKNVPIEAIAEITTANAKKLFNF